MSPLSAEDFASFMKEVHGHGPFPWQQALVEKVLEAGRWPDVLNVPTGLGKTSVIDAFVFVAAARPELARRRLFFVVDRRLIVDEAFQHAEQLAAALRHRRGPWSTRVAAALQQADDDVPLQVTRMRGGVTWSWRWLERPDRFAVVVGTVDQVGSRLLFRGYGVGEHLRPIDAALVGTDSLIVIDEAPLAQPFRQTVRSIQRLEPSGGAPELVTMSATIPDEPNLWVHETTEADEHHEHAGRRLHAPRFLHLLSPAVTKKNAVTVLPQTLAQWAQRLAGSEDSGRVVGVICNTLARARAVFEQLDGAVLLTGRVRPVDRDYLLHKYYERLRAGRERKAGQPLIVVATQTIEVGANLDFDAVVTESAALPALIQRLGRLNRLASLPISHALVVHDGSVGSEDPVYGPAREATWNWLLEHAPTLPAKATELGDDGLLVSPIALRALLKELSAERRATMQPAVPYIPQLTSETLDAWSRTSPPPCPDPPVPPFLHGIDHGRPDVSIVWRAGLPSDLSLWATPLNAVPPATEEMLDVPYMAARRWLAGLGDETSSDLEGLADADEPTTPNGPVAVRYINPAEPPVPVTAAEVRPGDLIVVAAERGGCDRYGWNPSSNNAVPDVADLAERRGQPVIRLRRELLDVLAEDHEDLLPEIRALIDLLDDPDGLPDPTTLKAALPSPPTDAVRTDLPFERNLRILRKGCTVVPHHEADGRLVAILAAKGGGLRSDEGALYSSAAARGRVSLADHQEEVRIQAERFAKNLRLTEALCAAVAKAAQLHDEGKRDPRFQAMLYQRPLRAHTSDSKPLAKSGMDPMDREGARRARVLAEYPSGMRHEAFSARIAAKVADADELVTHLVVTHHGRARPLLPAIHDPDPQPVNIGSLRVTDHSIEWDAPDRFAALNQEHGRWRLALLEAIVRLADIRCSKYDTRGPLNGSG
jgi:CRISPR-associated endonuclease/helicase Cas3